MRKKSIQTTKNIASHVDKNPVDPLDIIKENVASHIDLSKVPVDPLDIIKENASKVVPQPEIDLKAQFAKISLILLKSKIRRR
jgi:hypothetical protein